MFNKTLAVVKINIRSLAIKSIVFTLIVFPLSLLLFYYYSSEGRDDMFLITIGFYLYFLLLYCVRMITRNHQGKSIYFFPNKTERRN